MGPDVSAEASVSAISKARRLPPSLSPRKGRKRGVDSSWHQPSVPLPIYPPCPSLSREGTWARPSRQGRGKRPNAKFCTLPSTAVASVSTVLEMISTPLVFPSTALAPAPRGPGGLSPPAGDRLLGKAPRPHRPGPPKPKPFRSHAPALHPPPSIIHPRLPVSPFPHLPAPVRLSHSRKSVSKRVERHFLKNTANEVIGRHLCHSDARSLAPSSSAEPE